MRYLLSLTLTALAAAFLAGCSADLVKSNDYTLARTTGGPDCRRFAQPGDTKIQIYCKRSRPDTLWPIAAGSHAGQTPSGVSCRRLATSITGRIQTYCGTPARWDDFDTRAAKIGVTCRWVGNSHLLARADGEVCLDGNQWVRAEANLRRRNGNDGPGVGWGGDAGWTGGSAGAGQQPYASSYGPFPAGGAIGQTFQ